jgi:hypothetical protein
MFGGRRLNGEIGARIGEGARVTSPRREIRRIGPKQFHRIALRCPHDCGKPRTRANFAGLSREYRRSQILDRPNTSVQASLLPATAARGMTRSSLGAIGVTFRSSFGSAFIVQCPSNSAPLCTTRIGVVKLPKTLAVGRI